jgi:lipopolysaccharide export system permease protein
MSLIVRYLLRQFLGPLLTCLVAFNGIFVLFDLSGHLSRFLDADLPLPLVLKYYLGVVCTYSPWFLPASCMLATLYSMWQLSHHSELTAMRASGISFHRLTLPFFCTAIAASLLTFANEEWFAPPLGAWSDRLKESGFSETRPGPAENVFFTNYEANRTWRIARIDLTSDETAAHVSAPEPDADGNAPPAVEIKVRNDEGRNVWGVRADRADWLDGKWWLSNPRLMAFDEADGMELPDTAVRTVDLPGDFPFPELTEKPRDIRIAEQKDNAHLSSREMLRKMRTSRAGSAEDRYDFWYRIAAPWACLVITLFSIPAGITTGRQSVFKGILLVLVTFFSFYAFTLLLKYFGQHGALSPVLAAWLPNLVFLAIGGAMYRRLT